MGIIVAQNDQALASLVNSMSQSGVIGNLPAAAAVIAGSFYYDTTNNVLKQEQGGAWVDILQIKTLNPANETVEAGYYAATTLSAVDADLAVGNIKDGVTIFGFLGTLSTTLIEDILGSAVATATSDTLHSTAYRLLVSVGAESDLDIATKTQTYDASSMAVAVGFSVASPGSVDDIKLRLYMDGVQIAESAYFTVNTYLTIILVGTRALSGSTICKIALHNYNVAGKTNGFVTWATGEPYPAGIGIGSIKI